MKGANQAAVQVIFLGIFLSIISVIGILYPKEILAINGWRNFFN